MGSAGSVGMGAWMVLWAVVGLVALVLAVAGAVWLLRRDRPTRYPSQAPVAPEDVLRQRYAAGEVDEDEYLRRLAGLSHG